MQLLKILTDLLSTSHEQLIIDLKCNGTIQMSGIKFERLTQLLLKKMLPSRYGLTEMYI